MEDKLFVYGTLGPGQPNEHHMAKIGGIWTKGSIHGFLIEEGWAAELGYPAIRLDQTAGIVNGHLFQSDNLPNHWDALDEFEGEEYVRVPVEVTLENGEKVMAYVYEARPDP